VCAEVVANGNELGPHQIERHFYFEIVSTLTDELLDPRRVDTISDSNYLLLHVIGKRTRTEDGDVTSDQGDNVFEHECFPFDRQATFSSQSDRP
jgi:hypothetical protein